MDLIGRYQTKPFSKNRKNIVQVARAGRKKNSAYALIELNVTKGRRIIKKYKEKHGGNISFTGWLVKCVAEAASKHKELNSYRLGRNKTVFFEDVDIPIPVERVVDGEARPMAYIIRKANEKSVVDITREIRSVQSEDVGGATQVLGKELTGFERFVLAAPSFLQNFILWLFKRNGILKKKYMGTVGVTAIGMKGEFNGWAIPLGGIISTLIAVGGISKKPGVVKGKVEVREYLHVTVAVDHDVVDGGPLARFVESFSKLVEDGYGLSDLK